MSEQQGTSAIKLWCNECQRGDYVTKDGKCLCPSCGKDLSHEHEVRHEIFPHLAGDTDEMY